MDQYLDIQNEKIGRDGLNAIQRRAQFMAKLDEHHIAYEVGIRYGDQPDPHDSRALLRLYITISPSCNISALFSPNCVVGGYIETMIWIPQYVLNRYHSLDVSDIDGIAKWSASEELLQYILKIKRVLKV